MSADLSDPLTSEQAQDLVDAITTALQWAHAAGHARARMEADESRALDADYLVVQAQADEAYEAALAAVWALTR